MFQLEHFCLQFVELLLLGVEVGVCLCDVVLGGFELFFEFCLGVFGRFESLLGFLYDLGLVFDLVSEFGLVDVLHNVGEELLGEFLNMRR